MIVWCAYCQRYQGEKPAFDDYRLSHGICPECERAGRFEERGAEARVAPLLAFYDRLRDAARRGDLPEASALLEEGTRLGVRPTDLAFGMLQPILHEIGDRWARGEIDVATEHAASARVRDLLDLVYPHLPESAGARDAPSPSVLLCVPPRNAHTLGVDFVELALLIRGVPTMRVKPSASKDEIARVAAFARPRWVGISIALPGQLADAKRVAKAIASQAQAAPPRIVVGGGPFRHGAGSSTSGLTIVPSADDFVAMVTAAERDVTAERVPPTPPTRAPRPARRTKRA